MLRLRAVGIRGQLVVWYLGVLAVLLLALGIFQSLILGNYLRSSLVSSMRQAARGELAVLGPCYIRSRGDLRNNAQSLAALLGSHETAVKIVTASGLTLADHGLGPPGATKPLRLSSATIHDVIRVTAAARRFTTSTTAGAPCRSDHRLVTPPISHPIGRHTPSISSGNTLLLGVALGTGPHPPGYAILGHSLGEAEATQRQADLIFALGAISALLIAGLVALPTLNRALRPLRRVATIAEAIAEGDLAKRANLAHSPDEIGRLGHAFDRMVDRLQSALSAALASEERMRRFLADASHELRTPVTVLRGASQVLLRQGGTGRPELDEALRDMHDEAIRLSHLVDDLLTLSRIDAGQMLAPEPVHVAPFLQEFVQRYGSVWPARAIQVEKQVPDGAVASVDPEALRRIVTNLVDNAARYNRPEGVITLTSRADAGSVVVAVRDEGPGMSSRDASKVFDRFYRANQSRSRQSGGTGLGLAIVQGLVEQSGGRVELDTAPDRGTTVRVALPRAG